MMERDGPRAIQHLTNPPLHGQRQFLADVRMDCWFDNREMEPSRQPTLRVDLRASGGRLDLSAVQHGRRYSLRPSERPHRRVGR